MSGKTARETGKETEKKARRGTFSAQDLREAREDIHFEGNALKRILAYAIPYWKVLLLCLILVLTASGLEIYRPQLIRQAIDRYIDGGFAAGEQAEARFAGVLRIGAVYLIVLVVTCFFSRVQMWLMQRTGQQIIEGMRNDIFAHVESLTMRFFDTTPVGKVVTRLTNDVESINEVFTNILVNLIRNVVMIAGLVAVMFWMDGRLALISLAMVPVMMGVTWIYRKLCREAYQVTRTRVTDLNTFLSEHLSGMHLIQVFGRQKQKLDEFEDRNESLFRAGFREMMVHTIFRPLIYFISVMAMVLLLGRGSESVLLDTLSFGTLYAFIDYIDRLFQPIQELTEQFSTLQNAIASAEKIFTLMDTKPLFTDPEEPVEMPEIKGRIEFDHVWFAYQGEEWVLRDVSFTIEPGQRVAFVGATGAGKSSILNLIGRYYDVQRGSIRVDGVDVRQMRREQLRGAIGQVQQDVFLFTGDIAGNIRLTDAEITDEEVEAASREVNAARFVDRLPDGYRHPVTERGSTFSAGQRQLISFARTLAHDPAILVLDEATANIDTETEQWIQEATERLMRGRTTIMVAHRLSTIQRADTIMVIHHGRLRESGTHQELLAAGGIYHKLYQLQLAGQQQA